MLLYIMRHGPAALRDDPAYTHDYERPLTPDGIRKTRGAARGMRALEIKIDRVFTSPLKRARQTADIVCAELHLPAAQLRVTPALEPGAPPMNIFREINKESGAESVLVVGHEPNLSELISLLTTGDAAALSIEVKKASLALVEVDALPPADLGVLRYILQPGHLRALGKKMSTHEQGRGSNGS